MLKIDGIYSLPSYLSEGAKRSIGKMLVTNSEERATIQQIFDDPWFQVDLPEYLIPATTGHIQGQQGRENATTQLDEGIVTKVAEVFQL
jgi:carbon catabolite-derepressing protein kinase